MHMYDMLEIATTPMTHRALNEICYLYNSWIQSTQLHKH